MLRVFNLIRSLNSMFVLMLKLLLLLLPPFPVVDLKTRDRIFYIFNFCQPPPTTKKGRGFGVYARQKKKNKKFSSAMLIISTRMAWDGMESRHRQSTHNRLSSRLSKCLFFFLVYTHTLARLIVNSELTTKSKELFVHRRVILFTICPCSTVHYIRLSLS